MVRVIVTDRAGAERAITVEPGFSLMEALRDNGFDDLLVGKGHCDYLLNVFWKGISEIVDATQASAGASSAGAASSPPPCCSPTALTARANIEAGSARTRASMARA